MHTQSNYIDEVLRSFEGVVDEPMQPHVVHASMVQSPPPLPPPHNTHGEESHYVQPHGWVVEVIVFIPKISSFSFSKLHVYMQINSYTNYNLSWLVGTHSQM